VAQLELPADLAKALVASDKHLAAAEAAVKEYEALGLDASAQRAVVQEARRLRNDILAKHSPYTTKK
jgi:hypothetical protein